MIRFLQIFIFIFLFTQLSAQKFRVWESTEDDIISCPHSGEKSHAPHNPIPFKNKKGVATAEFIPNYIDVPDAFITTVEFVFDQLTRFISSEIPIHVSIQYTDLGTSEGGGVTLADARPGSFAVNFAGAEFLNTVYPISLAEKLAESDLNQVGEPDIIIRINSNQAVNFSIEPNNPNIGSRSDLATVLLHEVIHGLGFSTAAFVDDSGIGFLQQDIYGMFLQNIEGNSLLEDFPNNSIELGDQLTSNRLRFRSPRLIEPDAIIHAPTIYNPGSSISHLDLGTYRNTPSRLMSPAINGGDINYEPGIVSDMLADMGWETTNIIHSPEEFFNEDASEDYELSGKFRSDSDVVPTEIIFHFSRDTFQTEDNTDVVAFDAATDDYLFSIAAANEFATFQYYFEVVGADGTITTTPKTAPDQFYEFIMGPDTEAPVLSGHIPLTTIRESDSQFTLEINEFQDFFTGVDLSTLSVVVSQNGQLDTTAFVLMEDDFGEFYQVTVTGNFSSADELLYKIIILDNSNNRNEGQLPLEDDFYTIDVQAVGGAIGQYINTFDEATSDFTGVGFDIIQVDGFESPAIHSEHPYQNAGQGNTLNFTYQLSQLIRISNTDPTIVFDEIVIVEPGETGTSCDGSNCDTQFWDYVIVEAQKPGDENWTALLDGYDANDQNVWRFVYDREDSGRPTQFRSRRIDMTETGDFFPGDEVFIRFRLFSDPFATGWGWAIDNLEIQTGSSVLEEELLEEFKIYPNPSYADQSVSINVDIKEPIKGQLNFLSSDGRLIWQDAINGLSSFQRSYNTGSLPSGVYIIQIASTEGNSSRKLIISR
jgi:hypothetical protein